MRSHNPFGVRLVALAVAAGVIILATSTVNLLASSNVYAEPGKAGVLMPEVAAVVQPVQVRPEAPTPEKPDIYEKRMVFRVPDADIQPNSFVSLSNGTTLKILSVKPITATTKDERGKSILLLMDNSYSMVQPSPPSPWNADWLPVADPEYKRIEAVKALVEVLGETDRVALATFPRLNPNPGYRVPRVEPPALMKNFGPPKDIIPELGNLRSRENSGTPLYRVLRLAADWIAVEPKNRARVAVMLTDGRDTESESGVPRGLRERIEASGMTLIIIALGPAPDLEVLKTLGDEVIPVSESSQLIPTFRRLAEKLETKTVGYDVELDLVRENKEFVNGEDVVIGFRSGDSPKKMTLKVGVTPVPPTDSAAPAPKAPAEGTTPKPADPNAPKGAASE